MSASPIFKADPLMVDQEVNPAAPISSPTYLTSGPTSENIFAEICNSCTISNQLVITYMAMHPDLDNF